MGTFQAPKGIGQANWAVEFDVAANRVLSSGSGGLDLVQGQREQ